MVSKLIKTTSLLLFITFCGLLAQAQPLKSFSDSAFVSQLNSVFQKETNPMVSKVMQDFTQLWTNGKFTSDERKKIIVLANYIYKKHLKMFPVLSQFLGTGSFLSLKSKPDFGAYLLMLEYMSGNQNVTSTAFALFIEQIYGLVANKTIYTSKTLLWKSSNPQYQFFYDDTKHEFTVSIKNTDLLCNLRTDSVLVLKNTDGTYDPLKSIWYGQNGKAIWARNGFDENSVYAKMREYRIDLSKSEYSSDSVTFVNKLVLNREILGKFQDKITHFTLNKKQFPVFVSYENDIELPKMLENINYLGGISMTGTEIIGVGTDYKPAEIGLKKDGQIFLRAFASEFTFGDKVRTENARIILNLTKKDTIYHPSAKTEISSFSFNITRTNQGSGKSNFFDSYHNLEIDAQRIEWPTKDTCLFIYQDGMPDGINFYSSDFFTPESFDKIQMMETDNPLFAIQRFMRLLAAKEKIRLAADNAELRAAMGLDEYSVVSQADLERIAKKISVQEIQTLKVSGFYAVDFAKFWLKETTAVRQRLIELSYSGFLEYNSSTQYITVLPKLYHYTTSRAGAKDYDIIVINSKRTKNFNAILDLKHLDLMVEGVSSVHLSRAKRTGFIPSDNSVTIRRNRELIFSGKLRTGMMDFYGKNFDFNYEKFDITFTKIDSAAFAVETTKRNKMGLFETYHVNSTLEHLSGKIMLDKPNNKSGKDTTTFAYPMLTNNDTSKVFYDTRNAQGPVYDRRKFYFSVYPFQIDSLSSLKENSIRLAGKLYSKSIFPDFEENLSIQRDKSLGFVHKTPKEGFKIFNGKAKLSAKNSSYVNTITLSNKGFGGSGEINWLTMTIDAGAYNFFPDSMRVIAKTIKIDKNTDPKINAEYPVITGDSVDVHWSPNKELVRCKNLGKEFQVFSGKAKFGGILNYSTKGIAGNGKLELEPGIFNSEHFGFFENSVFSPKANINFKANNEAGNTLQAQNMRTYVDLTSQNAVFQSIGDSSSVIFPKNLYTANPNHFVWGIGKRHFEIDSDITPLTVPAKVGEGTNPLNKATLKSLGIFDENLYKDNTETARYMSLHRGQDSLRIYASKSSFNGEENQLTIKEVASIDVADVTVIPASDVIIDQGAVMEKLLSTTLKVGTKHTIGNVDINIKGRNEYQASTGTYIYFDENKTAQNIVFDNIVYDKTDKRSEAHGLIKKEQKFTLNPYFEYSGDVDFLADKDYLRFYGFAKIVHTCKSTPFWFHFDSYIKPDSVYIPLENRLHSADDTRVFADFMVGTDSVFAYTSFMSNMPKNSESFLSLRDSVNYIFYDKQKIRYRISNLQKLGNKNLPGNYIDLDTKNCIASGEGTFNFDKFSQAGSGDNFGQVKLTSAGTYQDDMPSGKIDMQIMLGLDFFISPELMKIIDKKISQNFNLAGVDPAREEYKKSLQQFMGTAQANDVMNEMLMNGGLIKKMPVALDKSIFFSDLKFTWNQNSKSFKSYGKIGIGALNKKMLNKYVDGYVEIVKRRGANRINIYLLTNTSEWFFFSYSNGIMRVVSSVTEFNDIINKLKDKDRQQHVEQGVSYSYYFGSATMKDDFIRDFLSSGAVGDSNIITPQNDNLNKNPDDETIPDDNK